MPAISADSIAEGDIHWIAAGVELLPRCRSWETTAGRLTPQAWACEALEDHYQVAEADDTRTNPPIVGRGTPSRDTGPVSPVTEAHKTGNGREPGRRRSRGSGRGRGELGGPAAHRPGRPAPP
jgi:hypothetical protein